MFLLVSVRNFLFVYAPLSCPAPPPAPFSDALPHDMSLLALDMASDMPSHVSHFCKAAKGCCLSMASVAASHAYPHGGAQQGEEAEKEEADQDAGGGAQSAAEQGAAEQPLDQVLFWRL